MGAISIRAVDKVFPGATPVQALAGIDLEVPEGEFAALLGPSGCGKSTLLNLIAGLDEPDEGRILFDGIDLGALDDDARTHLRRDRMGFVFQAFHILPHLDLGQNVGLPLMLSGVARAECAGRARALLEEVGLGDRVRSMPRELSGGELQRVAIARALVGAPQIVLADEPTGNLDAENARAVLGLLRDTVHRHGAAGILVTHSLLAARTTDRILTLRPGGLVPGPPDSAEA